MVFRALQGPSKVSAECCRVWAEKPLQFGTLFPPQDHPLDNDSYITQHNSSQKQKLRESQTCCTECCNRISKESQTISKIQTQKCLGSDPFEPIRCLGCWLLEVRYRAAGYASGKRNVAWLQSSNIPHPERIACCPVPDLQQPAIKASNTINGNNTHIVSSSWWWA
jgi:hypothetical protein